MRLSSRFFIGTGYFVLLWTGMFTVIACGNPQQSFLEKPATQEETNTASHREAVADPDSGTFEANHPPDLVEPTEAAPTIDHETTPDRSPLPEPSTTTDASNPVDHDNPDQDTPEPSTPEPVSEPSVPTEQGTTQDLLSGVDQAKLLLVLGDSIGAGYNASKGRSFDALLYQNTAYPTYQGHDLKTRYPAIQLKNIAKSGATSSDMLSRLKSNLSSLPTTGSQEDTIVLISIGGNDFNDKIQTMLVPTAAIQAYEKNMTEVVTLLRQKYENPQNGRQLLIFVNNIHDPTGGTAKIPPQYTDGFCKILQNPLLPTVASTVLKNLADFNTKIASIAQRFNLHLIDNHSAFLQHGMNAAGTSRWIDNDCVHFNNEGHHQLRRLIWEKMTGQSH